MKTPHGKKKTKTTATKGKPYPYTIPPVTCPLPGVFAKLDPWYLTEFIRIEALLRSEKVMRLYGQDRYSIQGKLRSVRQQLAYSPVIIDPKTDTLLRQFRVMYGWLVLDAAHHDLLSPETVELLGSHTDQGCIDLCKDLAYVDKYFLADPAKKAARIQREIHSVTEQIKDVLRQDKGRRYALLLLDSAFPPHTILRHVKTIITKKHDSIKMQPCAAFHADYPLRFMPNKRPPIRGWKNFETCCNYIRCYDLRERDGEFFGDVAQKVYGSKNARDRAEKAYVRFKRLIEAAENNNWPPPAIR